jgi:hypothetical protein
MEAKSTRPHFGGKINLFEPKKEKEKESYKGELMI